jgi:hypothetical protein
LIHYLEVERSMLRSIFKEGHAAKSAEERRHSNHNMRAHLGEIYITTATTKAAVSPITTTKT